ncbi:hypothetical protein P280DRAFT_262573 [Massarina eburnea CBS 473.64]|uniref:Uncharacterized protein n=1 Tax=Massarina eburnea CBS 473.64 TaxID=1395130 RepID=A0A6A6S389_9PLEO|nr:hypothetical protein P280DRAFT_262573 [Massarina eburnea CBS 473.64]
MYRGKQMLLIIILFIILLLCPLLFILSNPLAGLSMGSSRQHAPYKNHINKFRKTKRKNMAREYYSVKPRILRRWKLKACDCVAKEMQRGMLSCRLTAYRYSTCIFHILAVQSLIRAYLHKAHIVFTVG